MKRFLLAPVAATALLFGQAALAGSSPPPPPLAAPNAFAGLPRALKADRSVTLMGVGDSTMDDPQDWFVQLGQKLGTNLDPTARRVVKYWDDSIQDFGAWTVLNAGTATTNGVAGERYIKFDFTDANERGRTSPISNHKALSSNDFEVWADVALDSWANGAQQDFLTSYTTGAGNRGITFSVNSVGRPGIDWTTDGTTTTNQSARDGTAVSFTAGQRGIIRATLTANVAGNMNTKFYTCTAFRVASTCTQLGSTVVGTGAATVFHPTTGNWSLASRSGDTSEKASGKFYAVAFQDGLAGPDAIQQPVDNVWQRTNTNVPSAIYGSRTIYIVNGSRTGQGLSYFTDSTRMKMEIPFWSHAWIYLSSSHNDTFTRGKALTDLWDTWLTGARERNPNATIIAVKENPEGNCWSYWQDDHPTRVGQIGQWATKNGLPVLDVYEYFRSFGGDGSAAGGGYTAYLDMAGIGSGACVHPTQSLMSGATAPYGSDLVAAFAASYYNGW